MHLAAPSATEGYIMGEELRLDLWQASTGERGDRVLLDDPHNIKESESDQVRTETVRWFKEAMSNPIRRLMERQDSGKERS